MKLPIKLVLSLIVFSNLFISCHKTEDWKSSHPRLISLNNKMNISDAENAGVSFTVEFYDEDNGERVSSFEWDVEYNGEKVLMEIKRKEEFEKHPVSGLAYVTFDWSYDEILEKLEVDKKEINNTSKISFTGTLKRDDGVEYTHVNIGNNPEFDTFYFFEVEITCEIDYSGTVDELTTSCGLTFEGEVELTGESGYFLLEKEKGLSKILEDCFIGPEGFDYHISIQEDCNLFWLNLFHFDYSIHISNLTIDESILKVNWFCIDDGFIVQAEGETIWTRIDGKKWSPDLYID